MKKIEKTAYELSQSQVTTPERVVAFFWNLTHQRRARIGSVLDMGCGDARFARFGRFQHYVGVEIDREKAREALPPKNGQIVNGCAFQHRPKNYDACVGNPPYVRHHYIESRWKQAAANRIKQELGITLNGHCNLYLYFVCLGLLKTSDKGLLSLLIPYEWVSRPSADAIRRYVQEQRWNVDVYRFKMAIFKDVLTTASVSIVDKATSDRRWSYYDIDADYQIHERVGAATSKNGVLHYSNRGEIWALRGLSPGSQEVFTLTEGERIHFGLTRNDVTPCVTTLKDFPPSIATLTKATFRKHFVEAGARCWLIRSNKPKRSKTLDAYLQSVPAKKRDTYTCRNQTPWFNFLPHPAPQLLISSGFVKFGPKVLVNSVGAVAVGSAFGIHSNARLALRQLQRHLCAIDFESRVVPHARTLKKIEVKQFNAVLKAFSARARRRGKTPR